MKHDSGPEFFEGVNSGGSLLRWPDPRDGRGKQVSRALVNFVYQLLLVDPRKRLGYEGAASVKKNKWFRGFDWQKCEKRILIVSLRF